MGVQIDEPRRDHVDGRVDLASGDGAGQISDRRDPISIDRQVGPKGCGSRSVQNRTITNDEVMSHASLPLVKPLLGS